LRVLRRALPKSIAKQLRRLEQFTELLGRHHDFHVLQVTLNEAAAHGLEVAKYPALHQCITKKMGRCLKRTRQLSDAIFELRPKELLARVHAGWRAWRGKA
jgi:hypothetical protein